MNELNQPIRKKENAILTIKEISYMIKVIESDLSDEEKAYRTWEFANLKVLDKTIKSYNFYNDPNSIENAYLKRIRDAYRNYHHLGYIFPMYNCSKKELNMKIQKLKEINTILNSNDIDYAKVDKIISLFSSSEKFRKEYLRLINFGLADPMLDPIKDELKNFDYLLNKFKKYEEAGIVKDVKYLKSIEIYHRNYEYAKFAINHYIDSDDSYKSKDFLNRLGLKVDDFNFCVDTIKELDVDLYKKFLVKKEKNRRIRFIVISKTIENIAYGIQNGHLKNGKPFTVIEFIKMVPFKDSDKFINTLITFIRNENPKDFNTIWNYMTKNRLNSKDAFKKININKLNDPNTKTIINNVKITKEINEIIINYMKINNIPLVNKAYYIVRKKYLNGEINLEELNKKSNNKSKIKNIVLIPSSKK